MTRLGDSMDVPYEDNPPGTSITDDFVVCGGTVVMASHVDVPDVGRKPALVFRFSTALGKFLPPVLLVLDDDQIAKFPTLVTDAVRAARRAAKEAS